MSQKRSKAKRAYNLSKIILSPIDIPEEFNIKIKNGDIYHCNRKPLGSTEIDQYIVKRMSNDKKTNSENVELIFDSYQMFGILTNGTAIII